MEENNTTNQAPQYEPNINQQFNAQFGKKILPNSVGALVLGIISIFFSVIWCYWIGSLISLACGIIGIVLSKGGRKLLEINPSEYTQGSINNNNAGRIMSIIGVCLASLEFLFLIVAVIFFGAVASNLKGFHY